MSKQKCSFWWELLMFQGKAANAAFSLVRHNTNLLKNVANRVNWCIVIRSMLAIYCVLVQFNLPQVKRDLISSTKDLVCELLLGLLWTWDFTKIGKLGKFKNWMGIQPSAQSAIQRKTLVIVVEDDAKANIKIFWSCLILLDFFTLW